MQGTITDERSRSVESDITAINEVLAEKIGAQKYRIWFKNSTKFTLLSPGSGDGGVYLKICVPNLFIANWIENHFSKQITQAVHKVIGIGAKITFTIDPELSGNSRQIRSRQAEGRLQNPAKTQDRPTPYTVTTPSERKKLKLTLDTFVVGPSNELAYNAAKAVVNESQSPFNPLFIHGGYGLGKTHLLQGICNELSKIRPETNWLYICAEDFANQFVLALKTKKLQEFRRKMRQTDLLAIDDIHFLANKPSTQEEFLHTFNTISLAGSQVILVSDAHPKMISQLSEKLANRFISGMVVKITPPDFQTRCRICTRFASNVLKTRLSNNSSSDGCHFPESVISYIAEKVRSNVRELEGAILKLIAYSSLRNERVSLSMAKSVLPEHLERCDPIVQVSDIESSVSSYFGTIPSKIHSSKKDRTLTLARHFSMYLARKHTDMSSSEIGRFMGNKNHATVLLACKKIEQLIKQNAELHWQGPQGNKVAKAKTILSQLEESISE
jgi:chromosomal replication initiator protein